MNGARSLIETLVAGRVDVCFTNPGTSEMHFVAALDDVPQMRAVLGLFEGVCTGAADGFGRMTGRPAATLLHLGPGLSNGAANLHNARRARTPLVNIVGDHATYHLAYDAPLTSDIEGLARPVSAWVRTSASADAVAADAAAAVTAARTAPGQIATLILPADTAWNTAAAPVTPTPPPSPTYDPAAVDRVHAALNRDAPTLLLVSGAAAYGPGAELAGRIAAATGADLMTTRLTARRQLGAGRPIMRTLAYPVPHAVRQLAPYAQIVLIGATDPVAFFAYPEMPSRLAPPSADLLTLAAPGDDVLGALADLADRLPADPPSPVYRRRELAPPSGALTLEKVWQGIGAQLPENAILVEESITSFGGAGQSLWHTPPYDMLSITGGSIGFGLPQAVGAAVACPDRPVIVTQADGSALYTFQALWTMARESLDVTVVLFNNRAYRILQAELQRVGAAAGADGPAAAMLSLDAPTIDFVQLARGLGVSAERADSADALNHAFGAALAEPGPHLIEVMV